jgi:colanic acid biosynthesis protein WcaH
VNLLCMIFMLTQSFMFLDKSTFTAIIDSTPLVSIDLVVLSNEGNALLGERLNRPAQGYWFVPGGRITKNESLADAFSRLTLDELGEAFSITDAELLGPYDHFYDDYVFGEGMKTHYVAIAYVLRLTQPLSKLPMHVQHGDYRWFSKNELFRSISVHKHSKWYFEALHSQGKL